MNAKFILRAFFSIAACFMLTISHLAAAPVLGVSPSVTIGGKTVVFAAAPFLSADGQLYAPVSAVSLMGASYAVDAGSSPKTIKIAAGTGLTATVPCLWVRGSCCVPLQAIALWLGADTNWQASTRTLTIRAKLEMIRVDSGVLILTTSYPIPFQVMPMDKSHCVSVNLFGLDEDTFPASVPAADETSRIHSDQISFNTVRVTLEIKDADGQTREPFPSAAQGNQIRILVGERTGTAESELLQPEDADLAPPPSSAGPGVRITGVSLNSVTASMTQILIQTTGPAQYRTEKLENPSRLAFDVTGADIDPAVNPLLVVNGTLLKTVRSGLLHAAQTQYGRIVFDLASHVGYSVTSTVGAGGTMSYLVSLQMPPQTAVTSRSTRLAGKIIVLDPGHGAQDSGAVGIGGVREKDLTLAIGLRLRQVLLQSGATVFMTRQDDSFLPVSARPQVAIAHHADYFISIHCDSCGSLNSFTGTTVYFHAHNPVCRRMAADLSRRVAEVSGIPSDGVKSDTIRFSTGFGVLRGSPMPAVLIECGYVNNTDDLRKLKSDETKQQIAEGIVAGLKDFIADSPALTAQNEPKKEKRLL